MAMPIHGISLSREPETGQWKVTALFAHEGQDKIATISIDVESRMAIAILERNLSAAIEVALTPITPITPITPLTPHE